LVERVDFVSGDILGSGGELLVVTPLGVLGASRGARAVELLSVHPGVTFERIQACTGFALNAAAAVPTPAPSAAELAVLRSLADGRALAEMALTL
jgi:acyl CoA:acetate/3-ketoacid CoA transferase beta subunit